MTLKKIVFFTLLFFILSSNSVQAQTATATPEPTLKKNIVREEMNKDLEEKKKEIEDRLKKKKEEFNSVLQERMKVASDSFAQRKEELRLRLQAIKDEKKREVVARINEKIKNINKRRTDHMLELLERLGKILEKLRQKVTIAKSNGKDTTSVDQVVDRAQVAIDNAQNAVGEQAPKVYQIEATSEAKLKPSVGKTISGLQADLRRVHALVIEARQAVAKAVKLAARLGMNRKLKVTPTATQTVTITATPSATVTATPTP